MPSKKKAPKKTAKKAPTKGATPVRMWAIVQKEDLEIAAVTRSRNGARAAADKGEFVVPCEVRLLPVKK